MSVGRFLQQGAAGNAGEATYVDDVFSTYLYDGTGSGQTITNGIDLAGEGGLVWGKPRNDASNHVLMDTERYPTPPSTGSWLSSDSTAAESVSGASSVTSWNSDGLGISGVLDFAVHENVLWTFRKQPGFFDVVTYTGNGVAGTEIPHNLGSVPGLIIVKLTSGAGGWIVFHRSLGNTKYLQLNSTNAEATASWPWNNTSPTATHFTVGTGGNINASGSTYVAYLFAHDAQDFGTNSDESIIKCGSYTGNGSTTGPVIDLGFEPQWVMIKNISFANDWWMFDSMRGIASGGADSSLRPNLSVSENTGTNALKVTATGFQLENSGGDYNGSTQNYIYVAIRRPHKPASEFAATDLFDIYNNSSSTTEPVFRTSPAFPVDYAWFRDAPSGTDSIKQAARLTGTNYLNSTSTAAEATLSTAVFDYMNGWRSTGGASQYSWMFRRAPGFFDVVAYTGDGVNGRAIDHNLGAVPQLIIVKARNQAEDWPVYSQATGNDSELYLNFSLAASAFSSMWYDTDPTETQFTVGSDTKVNRGGGSYTYIAYLFASVPGISKVGSYSGTGATQTIDCGFSSGARFVLIKRTDSTGSWSVFDSERGIVVGNDPVLYLQLTNAETTTVDWLEPDSSGFKIVTSQNNVNASGGTYIFLAIA